MNSRPPGSHECKVCFPLISICLFFFFNDTATTEIYTLSLHDALPICGGNRQLSCSASGDGRPMCRWCQDRKSTRLNSSHVKISYAVFCLKKKTQRKSKQKRKRVLAIDTQTTMRTLY